MLQHHETSLKKIIVIQIEDTPIPKLSTTKSYVYTLAKPGHWLNEIVDYRGPSKEKHYET